MAANDKKLTEPLYQLTDKKAWEGFNPLYHTISFSHPLRQVSSAWTQHIPFAMFLIDLLRPQTIVELGTFTGASYCAFCQAVKELNLDTRCYAVDNWKGDLHNGFYDQSVLDNLKRHHDPLYGSFSQLIQSDFKEALSRFEDGSIDLLHIDGQHTYEAVSHDFKDWLPKLSDHGIVLLHNIEMYEQDFGVWRFWKELKAKYSSFELKHRGGLGLVAPKRSQPAALSPLMDAPEPEQHAIREFFFRLGSDLETRLEQDNELHDYSVRLEVKEQETQSLIAQLSDKEMQLASITSSLGWRILSRYGRVKYKYLLPVYRAAERLKKRKRFKEALLFGLDTILPGELKVGKANALFISGWCFHTTQKIDRLEIIVEGRSHTIKTFRQGRRDIFEIHFPALDPKGHSYRSGFWTILKFPPPDQSIKEALTLRVVLNDGREYLERMGTILLKTED